MYDLEPLFLTVYFLKIKYKSKKERKRERERERERAGAVRPWILS
jgi:hypothetical protein